MVSGAWFERSTARLTGRLFHLAGQRRIRKFAILIERAGRKPELHVVGSAVVCGANTAGDCAAVAPADRQAFGSATTGLAFDNETRDELHAGAVRAARIAVSGVPTDHDIEVTIAELRADRGQTRVGFRGIV
jgi:hypothetical protein